MVEESADARRTQKMRRISDSRITEPHCERMSLSKKRMVEPWMGIWRGMSRGTRDSSTYYKYKIEIIMKKALLGALTWHKSLWTKKTI